MATFSLRGVSRRSDSLAVMCNLSFDSAPAGPAAFPGTPGCGKWVLPCLMGRPETMDAAEIGRKLPAAAEMPEIAQALRDRGVALRRC